MGVSLVGPPLGRGTLEPLIGTVRALWAGLVAAVARHLRRVTRERVLWVVMAIVLLLFAFVLITQPTGVGRGGR